MDLGKYFVSNSKPLAAASTVLAGVAGCYYIWRSKVKNGKNQEGKSKQKKLKKSQILGIDNIGNSCFLNSLIQCLAASHHFCNWLEEICETCPGTYLHSHLLSVIKAVNNESEGDSEFESIDPSPVLNAMRRHGWVIRSSEEQDCHELFHVLFSTIEEELLEAKNKALNEFSGLDLDISSLGMLFSYDSTASSSGDDSEDTTNFLNLTRSDSLDIDDMCVASEGQRDSDLCAPGEGPLGTVRDDICTAQGSPSELSVREEGEEPSDVAIKNVMSTPREGPSYVSSRDVWEGARNTVREDVCTAGEGPSDPSVREEACAPGEETSYVTVSGVPTPREGPSDVSVSVRDVCTTEEGPEDTIREEVCAPREEPSGVTLRNYMCAPMPSEVSVRGLGAPWQGPRDVVKDKFCAAREVPIDFIRTSSVCDENEEKRYNSKDSFSSVNLCDSENGPSYISGISISQTSEYIDSDSGFGTCEDATEPEFSEANDFKDPLLFSPNITRVCSYGAQIRKSIPGINHTRLGQMGTRKVLPTSPFKGAVVSQRTCLQCGFKTPLRYDSFESISLALPGGFSLFKPVPSSSTLQQLLASYFAPESVSGVDCEGCSGKQVLNILGKTSVKRQFVAKLPNCLCLHIQRNFWTEFGTLGKRTDFVEFPEILDLSPHTFSSQLSSKCSTSSSSTHGRKYYRLVAVAVHSGDAFSGHFYTYRREPGTQPGTPSMRWYLASDSSVKKVAKADVLTCSAYMLFYEKI